MNLTVGNTGAKRMGTPLHARVEQQILGRIQNGDWPVGSRLPKEEDLATELGVSRSTLRLAFSSLERKGLNKSHTPSPNSPKIIGSINTISMVDS